MANPQIIPMRASYFASFQAAHLGAQVPDLQKSFGLTHHEALKICADNLDRALPEKGETAGQSLYEIQNEQGEGMGHLWLAERDFLGKRSLFIADILIAPAFRGRGIGKQVLCWVNGEAKRRGYSEVSLHVFGANSGAARLYEASGFRPTSVHMAKKI